MEAVAAIIVKVTMITITMTIISMMTTTISTSQLCPICEEHVSLHHRASLARSHAHARGGGWVVSLDRGVVRYRLWLHRVLVDCVVPLCVD